eukprot:4309267-Pyramimonas_sp.AAC.1
MVSQNVRGVCRAVAPCEPCHWGLRWGSVWGHETCEGCAEVGAAAPCEPCRWGGPSVELPVRPRNV